MGILFGFAGRLGRLEYFLLSLGLGVVMTLLVFMMIGLLGPHFAATASDAPHEASTGLVLTIMVVLGPIFAWFSFALMAKRFRDIGWNPLHVILGWIGITIVDKVIASIVPSLALSSGDGTLVGALVYLFMVGSLLFWPGGRGGDAEYDPWQSEGRTAVRDRHVPQTPTPSRRVPDRPVAPPATGFGRRTV